MSTVHTIGHSTRPVEDFIAEHHADDRSYRWIARALCDATDGATDVTDKTIAAWHRAFRSDAEDVA